MDKECCLVNNTLSAEEISGVGYATIYFQSGRQVCDQATSARLINFVHFIFVRLVLVLSELDCPHNLNLVTLHHHLVLIVCIVFFSVYGVCSCLFCSRLKLCFDHGVPLVCQC